MAKNPVIQQAYERGKREGIEIGMQMGISKAIGFMQARLNKLAETPGIGPKTIEKFKQAFGKEYFK
ncbi:hypothetical protein QQ991_03140 [Weizmannia coagulans]|uniref:Uncharacterized protein n=2 Tax=Heyndrickxia TaxID=2837504 RepID=A0A0C5CTL7_HEYCO|nr:MULTISPECIES: hypothetical protein [Heyndrickxia]AJO24807.1 hypothetical protein SB48_HM08orf06342 [Heyndrickxia coagulans]AKN53753.1 hypothetical protein AB434_1348 [Heyndrickxia coagulans]ATW84529.1 hypothetical protein CIW84_16990 [Heyndrickxia coagulans]KGB30169.1 hypothetical protein IE89_06630 [Heyndrickxia coagulans]KXT21112.1 hypothetical protein UZ35_05955 [Heyndrickxia coagulans]